MVYRDSQTGQFVSSSGGEGQRETIDANISSMIPAADLAGGRVTARVTGDAAEMVDFTEILENDEVFVLEDLQGRAVMHAPATATAEGVVLLEYALSRDFEYPVSADSSAYWRGTDREEGIVDINHVQDDDTSSIWLSQQVAEPSHSDSVNALAAGADIDREPVRRHWHGDGPAFDRDDELIAPHQWQMQNISDHAVEWDLAVRLEGRIQELD